MNTQLGIGSLFLEGLLSFFSPCVLPLIPVYFAYLSNGSKTVDENGNVHYDRLKTFLLTTGFVLGIITVFAIASLAAPLLRNVFQSYRVLFEVIGGMFLVFMGLYALEIIQIPLLSKLMHNRTMEGSMSFVKAYLFGFMVSFAWTPCVGPMLAQAIMAASRAQNALTGWLYMGSYTLGFVLIFLIAGLFTSEVLEALKKFRNVTKYTGILCGLIVLGMGVWMIAQGCQDYSNLLKNGTSESEITPAETSEESGETDQGNATVDQYDFELKDGDGNTVSLKDYNGQVVILDFYETWCTYCNESLGTLAKADAMDDVQVLMVVTPSLGSEGDLKYIQSFLAEKGHSFHLLIDETAEVTRLYGVSGYPTTYFITPKGEYYGYIPGYLPEEDFMNLIEECRNR